jgi:two-component sensor histidine kinase
MVCAHRGGVYAFVIVFFVCSQGIAINVFGRGDKDDKTLSNLNSATAGAVTEFQWKDHKRLSWADFKGPVNALSDESAAATHCGIGFRVNNAGVSGKPEVVVYNAFYINKSWVRPDAKIAEILDHEQGHFDLCEIYTRRLRALLAEFRFDGKVDEFIKSTHEYYNLKRGELVFEEIDFRVLLEDTASLFRIAGRMDNIRFAENVIQNQPFVSDSITIKIVLNNLFSNAFKFQRRAAADKFVDVKIEVVDDNAIITVRDNGIGIHESHIGNIFTMFYRATTEEPGSGFGLYNVKDALNKLKGTIEVSSVVNEGTTFKVTIPGKANVAI